MARGLVGSTGETNRPTVASPLYKERYDLATGEGIDNPELTLGSYPVRVNDDGHVEVEVVTAG